MLVRLTMARWMRCASVWLRSVLLIFVLIGLTETVAGSILTRAEATRRLLQNTPIRCVMATKDGRTEDVNVINGVVYSALEGGMKPYVADLAIRTEKVMMLADGSLGMITGVTLPCYEELTQLGNVPDITWYTGWDDTVFATHEKVCVAGSRMMTYAELVDGVPMLTMTMDGVTDAFRVIGTINGTGDAENALWSPFYALYDWNINLNAERMSFILADNAFLEDWLNLAERNFAPTQDGIYPSFVQLIMQDEAYRNVEQASRRNELLLQIVEPLFTALVFAAGILASFLAVRARKTEIAILQSMGVGRIGLILQGLVETTVPCLLIFPAAALLGWRLVMTTALTGMYVLGALIPICIFMMRPLIHQLHE